MEVRIASENDKEKWNQFVDREGGSFHQYYDWKYIYEFKTQRFIPLLLKDSNSDITGIFPLVEQTGLVYPWLSSVPEGTRGGFLLSNSLSSEEKTIHLKLFFEYIQNNFSHTHSLLKIKEHIKFENGLMEPTKMLLENGYEWSNNSSMCSYVVNLENPFEEKIFRSMAKNLRNRIRHARKSGVSVIVDSDFTYFDDFTKMHIDMVKKFELVTKQEDYNQIRKIFQKKIKLFVGLVDSEPITALLCYYTPTTVYAAKGPYLPGAKPYLNNILPMCAAIRDACESGYQYYDLGITHSQKLAAYKEKFGARRIPMRIYTKKFSQFQIFTNKSYQYLKWGGKKLFG